MDSEFSIHVWKCETVARNSCKVRNKRELITVQSTRNVQLSLSSSTGTDTQIYH